ncbi:ABC transporter ATP-binding protein [Sulfidibacter corallicola]|uniref:ABC transporter ATP-binding protein n=1 Tax=Sulfidibacter corallicola TaxID=2818388 RepID=A0A8A4TPE8_SULCO|nr:ABC transporter ATP-binding protein [Sulfidibacter corallicola]QTD51307.1 ABC transporter ATP-binding protein [Sulfidibacter corallicola]
MISMHQLTKVYDMGDLRVTALKNISFEVAAGDFVAIMGSSGSGKSTLLNILGCLDRFDSGSYRLKGTEVHRRGDDELATIRNREIGFVFQNFNLLPRKTALQNVALPLLYRRERQIDLQRAASMLRRVGLGDRMHHRPMELSGGQCQRVAIARALINEPAIILADEPTGNLDSTTSADIMALFVELNEAGHTLVMVTHEEEIAAYASRTVRLKDGEIFAEEHRQTHA